MSTTIYTNSADRKIYLDVPVAPLSGTLDVRIFKSSQEVFEVSTVSMETGRYFINIPFFLGQEDGDLTVVWKFNYEENGVIYPYSGESQVSLVTPYLPLVEVNKIIGTDSDFTDKEIESLVRHIINAHTGQKFGVKREIKKISGTGESSLQLPERLISLNSIEQYGFGYKVYDTATTVGNKFLGQDRFRISGDGWWLKTFAYLGDGIKSDSQGYWSVNGPIFNPSSRGSSIFGGSQILFIDGQWGWKSVPAPVQEAARLLINDYACNDSLYRERYIEAYTTADWRLQFNSGAFARTGNVKADQLLGDFVLKRGWAII